MIETKCEGCNIIFQHKRQAKTIRCFRCKAVLRHPCNLTDGQLLLLASKLVNSTKFSSEVLAELGPFEGLNFNKVYEDLASLGLERTFNGVVWQWQYKAEEVLHGL